MTFNISQSVLASELRANLPTLVTRALETASPDEHELIKLAGQCINYGLTGVIDDDVVDMNAYGSNVPSTGARSFHVSFSTKQVRARPTQPKVEPWTPADGPLVARSAAPTATTTSPAATSPATPATGSTPVASPGSTSPATAATSPASPTSTGTGTARSG